MGPIHFGMVQISWTQPKLFEPEQPVQNHFGFIEGQGMSVHSQLTKIETTTCCC